MLFSNDQVTISFDDATNIDSVIDCLKDGEEAFIRIVIRIRQKQTNKLIARFERIFSPLPSDTYYNRFIAKFLTNPEYRKQYLEMGEWNGILEITTKTGHSITSVCRQGINRLNSKKNHRFKDFSQLKVGGRDDFSIMKLDEVNQLVPQNDIDEVMMQNEWTESEKLSCLRWIARGLKKHLAFRKIETNKIIERNANQRHKR
ncbi:MAG: hypothetical protein ACTSYA_06160 [Candidatus Kariarchaeaceae archaeon]